MIQRGQVWWVDLGEGVGSAPRNHRPGVVIQADPFNRSRIASVIVAVITSNLDLADAPGNVGLDSGEGGLPKASVVNVSQQATVDRRSLSDQSGQLSSVRMSEVDDGLRLSLAL